MVVHTCHPSGSRKLKIGGSQFRLAGAKSKTVSKITREEKCGGMAQAVELLSYKYKALSSNPYTTKKK
jgi:hypothetical protein